MSIFLKSSSNKFIQAKTTNLKVVKQGVPTGTVFYPVAYDADHITQSVTFPVAEGLSLNITNSSSGWAMSSDFDLIVVADSSYFNSKIHCGYYEVSYNIANCGDNIYIYNHNSYENGMWPSNLNGDPQAEGEWIYQNYSPLVTIWFETVSGVPGYFVEYH